MKYKHKNNIIVIIIGVPI